MRGSSTKSGKWGLSSRRNELEDSFEGLENDDGNAPRSTSKEEKVGLSQAEELRRLTAYVAHLREQVSEVEKSRVSDFKPVSHSAGTTVGLAILVGITSFRLGIVLRRMSRFA